MGKCTFFTEEIMASSVKEGVDLMTDATIKYERLIQEELRNRDKTGRIYRGEQEVKFTTKDGDEVSFTAYKGKQGHQASAAGESPSTDTGGLAQSIIRNVDVENNQVIGSVSSSKVYSIWLELGTSRMQARPMWRPKLEEMREWFKKRTGGKI